VLPASTTTLNVDAMQPHEAAKLLWTGLPSGEDFAFHALARRLGEWPLLLKLVNGVLRKRVEQYGQNLASALATVLQTLEQRGITAFDARNALERDQAVTKTVQLSVSLLSEDERRRYSELAIFPEDIDVPLSMVARLWNATGRLDHLATEDLCLRLSDLSLLLHLDLTRQSLRLHDVLRKYLQDQYDKESVASVHQIFLKTYNTDRWAEIDPSETYLYAYLPYHLFHAGRKTELKFLLLDFDWLWAKLAITDVTGLLVDCGWLPDDRPIQLLQGAIRLAAHVLALDKNQFAGQLLGRLQAFQTTDMRALLTKVGKWKEKPWLRPLTSTLTAPGGRLISTLAGHSDKVTAVAATGSGRIVSGSADLTVKIWNSGTGRMEASLDGHTDWITGVAVTPDGAKVISASADRTLRVWDLTARKLQHILKGHTGPVTAVAVTPDGKRIVSGSADGTLTVWDLDTGKEERTMEGREQEWKGRYRYAFMAVTVTANGLKALSASEDGTLQVWDLATGQEERQFAYSVDAVKAVAVTADSRHAVSASADSTLAVWDLASSEVLRILIGHTGEVMAATATPDGRVVSASRDGTLKIWDIATGRLEETLRGHTDLVTGVAVTPDGQSVVSASWDRTLKVWDLTAKSQEHSPTGHGQVVTKIIIPAGLNQCFSASADQTIKVWNIETGGLDQSFFSPFNAVHTLAVSREARRCVALGTTWFGRQTLRTWDLTTGLAEHRLAGRLHGATVHAITKDGRWAATGDDDENVTIWDLATGLLKQKLRRPQPGPFEHRWGIGSIGCLEVTQDNRWAAALTKQESYPKTLVVWDLASGSVRTFIDHADEVNSIAMTHDGLRLVSGSQDHTLRVYNLSEAREERALVGHAGPILSVTVTPDGQRAISGSADRTLKIWNLSTGQEERTLSGHMGDIVDVSVTADGTRIISASADHTLKVWDLSNGNDEMTLVGHTDVPVSISVMPDGRHVVSGSRDSLRLWDLAAGIEKGRIGNGVDARTVVAASDGESLFLVNDKSELRVFNLTIGVEDKESTWPSPAVDFVAISSDGRWAVVHNDNHLDVWEVATGNKQCMLEGTEGEPRHGCFGSADRLRFMSCGHPLRVWNLMTGKLTERFEGRGDWQTSAAYGGDRLVTGSTQGTLTVWDLNDCTVRHTLHGHTTLITGVVVTPDGNYAVSSSRDRTICVWDLIVGRHLHVLDSRSYRVPKMDVSPNGKWVACSSRDKAVDIFDLASGQRVCGISLDGPVSALGCGQAEHRVIFAVGEESGQVHLFTLEGLP
jgi:WD40 repeat protein